MEPLDFKNKWSSWKEKIRAEHPDMTDEELHYEEGKEEDLVKRLQERRKKTRSEIYDWLHLMG